MSSSLPGYPPQPPTSLVSPLLQLGLGVGLLAVAVWAYEYAKVVRATDAWAFNGLAAICALAGLLWLPFAVTALVVVLRNRRRQRDGSLEHWAPVR